MNRRNFRFTPLILLLALPVAPHAQEGAPPLTAPYVSVSIEVNGLAESAALLDETMRQLSRTLSEMAASPDDLTPEQLAAFTELTREAGALVVALDDTLQGLGPAIRNAEAPTREVLAGWIETARTEAIDPTLAAVDERVRSWLILTMLGVLLVVGLAGVGFVLATRQLRAMASVLRSIADDYEIVPRRSLAAVAPVIGTSEAEEPEEPEEARSPMNVSSSALPSLAAVSGWPGPTGRIRHVPPDPKVGAAGTSTRPEEMSGFSVWVARRPRG